MRVPVGSVVRRWVVAVVAFLTAATGVALGVTAVPASAAASPDSRPPIVTGMSESGAGVRVGFEDRSVDEDAFQLFRRGSTGFWEYVVEAPTRNQPGQGARDGFVDPSPNALRCYMVTAYDNAGGVNLQSRPACVEGGLDPFDTRSGTRVALPRITSVQRQSGQSVRVGYVDRSRNESRFTFSRRQGGTSVRLGESPTTTRTSVGQAGSFTDTLPTGTSNACYTVEAFDDTTGVGSSSNEVCLTPPGPLPAPPAGAASSRPIRVNVPGVSTAPHGSMAVGSDGLPIMSIQADEPGAARLGVVHCNNATCTSSTSTVFRNFRNVASAIVIGRDGLALVAYYGDGRLAVAHCSNLACTAATVTSLDTAENGMTVPSVSIGPDGLPTIAYQVGSFGGQPNLVKVAHCVNPACTSATISVIDTVHPAGGRVVATATSSVTGRTYVAYAAAVTSGPVTEHNVVKVAMCLNPACTQHWTPMVDWGHLGEQPSGGSLAMTIGRDDLPLLTYQAHDDVVAAHCVNVLCTDVTTTVVSERNGASSPHVAIGADGLGVIASNDSLGTNVVHCGDLACRTFSRAHVTSSGAGSASIAIGTDGRPFVFHGDAQTTLRLVRCPDATCSGGPFARPETTGPIRGIAGKCVEVLLASTDNGTPIQIITCSGHIAQNWTVRSDGTLRALGKCLTIAGADTTPGTPVQLDGCRSHWSQVWAPMPDGTLRNPISSSCLDTAEQGSGEWTRLVLSYCTPGTPSQIWRLPVA